MSEDLDSHTRRGVPLNDFLHKVFKFDPKKWVDDSFIRKAYAEMKLDYNADLASTKNYEISGEDKFCKKPISEPRKAGEVWVDDEGPGLPRGRTCSTN